MLGVSNVKKLRVLIILICFSISLTACTAKDPDNLFEVTEDNAIFEQESQPKTEIPNPVGALFPENGYQYGNMQKNVPSGNFMQYGTSILFLHTDNSRGRCTLYTYDMETGAVSLFCKDATCNHLSKSCPAYGADVNLEQYQGKIYASRLNGAVLELQHGRFEPITPNGVSHFWHNGGNLYVATTDSSLVVYEEGSAQPHILIEEYTGFWETIFGDYLYYSSTYDVNRIKLSDGAMDAQTIIKKAEYITDGESIYYAPEETHYLYRSDMDGSNPTLILDKPILPASWNFDEEYLYFRLYLENKLDGPESNVLYRMSKKDYSNIERIAELDMPIASVYTVPGFEKIFIIGRGENDRMGNNTGPIFVMSRNGRDIQPLELPEF